MEIPALPSHGASEWLEAAIPIRFEDLAQDGRMRLESMLTGLGATTWPHLFQTETGRALMGAGVVPILTRLVIEGDAGPFGVRAPVAARGAWAFAHARGQSGDVERILLGMWLELHAPISRVYGAPPDGAGRVARAGAVYAEHTLTRPFAEPGERRVLSLEAPGVDAVPGSRIELTSPEEVVRLPEGATWLDEAPVLDPAPVVFGLMHTDSNQHVNSLVYARAFEEASLRRIAAHGRPGVVLARRLHVAYRKPSFAGESSVVHVQLYAQGDHLGAVGSFAPAAQPDRPSCRLHLVFG